MSKIATTFRKRALTALVSSKYVEAESLYRKILTKIPNDEEAILNLGYALEAQGKIDEFFSHSMIAWEREPNNIKYIVRLGASEYALGKFKAAYDRMKELLRDKNLDYDAAMLLCALASELELNEESFNHALEAVRLNPSSALAHANLGSSFLVFNKKQEARMCLETALMLEPKNHAALTNLGVVHAKMGDDEKAICYYEKALNIYNERSSSKSAGASRIKFQLGLSQLAVGNLDEGWRNYEEGFNFNGPTNRRPQRLFNAPRWQGETITGKTLLVWGEQGVGDEIHFYSVIRELQNKGINVVVECDYRLVQLIQRSFPFCKVRPASYVPGFAADINDFDYQIPVGTLFGLYRHNKDSFNIAKPYLVPLQEKVEIYDRRLGPRRGSLRVGICWRSGLLTATRNENYTQLYDWKKILELKNIQLVNLQYGDTADEVNIAENNFNVSLNTWTDINRKDQFDDMAALIAALDVVVTIPTAVAHLAGSIGTRVIWMNLNRDVVQFGSKDTYPNYKNVQVIMPEPGGAVSDLLKVVVPEMLQMMISRPIECAV